MTHAVKSITALSQGVLVLQRPHATGALTLADLHRQTGIPKATLLRILRTLGESGAVWQRMVDGAWVPSFSLADMAGGWAVNMSWSRLPRPFWPT